MPARLLHRAAATLGPNDHPYRTGPWTPNFEEWESDALEIIGTIPDDIDGVYLRNTENPVHDSIDRYHPFDGDGMIHALRVKDGKARYSNRFVRTRAFEAEAEAGEPLWIGLMGNPANSKRPGWGAHGSLKDASSTDIVVHAGKALSTFYQCGEGYRLDPETLETLAMAFPPIARLMKQRVNCCFSITPRPHPICIMAWSARIIS